MMLEMSSVMPKEMVRRRLLRMWDARSCVRVTLRRRVRVLREVEVDLEWVWEVCDDKADSRSDCIVCSGG